MSIFTNMSTYKFDKVLYVFSAVKINEGYHDDFLEHHVQHTAAMRLCAATVVSTVDRRGGPISKIALIYRYNIDTLDISFICIS